MCGRYSLITSLNELEARFKLQKITGKLAVHYNAAPQEQLVLITNAAPRKITLASWGIIPAWLKDAKGTKCLINARAETLSIKPSFRRAAEQRRCLVIADGFYEWAQVPGKKVKLPFRITLKNAAPFAMAGIYEVIKETSGKEHLEFAIITVQANTLMAKLHTRMPAMLLPEDEARWLNPDISLKEAISLLKPYPAPKMRAYPVSSLVNNPKNEGPQLIEELPTQKAMI